METAKRTIRDSVFSDLFGNKKYLLQLYQTLHPEDMGATQEDLTDVTIQNVLTDDLYNDLGFRNGDRVTPPPTRWRRPTPCWPPSSSTRPSP